MRLTSSFKFIIYSVFIVSASCATAQDSSKSHMQVALQAAYNIVSKNAFAYTNGPSARFTVGTRLSGAVFLNLSYEFCKLGNEVHITSLSPEYASKNFLAGLDLLLVATAKEKYFEYLSQVTRTFKPTIGFGGHIGSRQKISRHFYATEQVGIKFIRVNGAKQYEWPSIYKSTFEGTLNTYFISAGIGYRF